MARVETRVAAVPSDAAHFVSDNAPSPLVGIIVATRPNTSGARLALAAAMAAIACLAGCSWAAPEKGPCLRAPDGPCYGFHPTCWRTWPPQCPGQCGCPTAGMEEVVVTPSPESAGAPAAAPEATLPAEASEPTPAATDAVPTPTGEGEAPDSSGSQPELPVWELPEAPPDTAPVLPEATPPQDANPPADATEPPATGESPMSGFYPLPPVPQAEEQATSSPAAVKPRVRRLPPVRAVLGVRQTTALEVDRSAARLANLQTSDARRESPLWR